MSSNRNNSDKTRASVFKRILSANGRTALPADIGSEFQRLVNKRPEDERKLAEISDVVSMFVQHAINSACRVINVATVDDVTAALEKVLPANQTLAVAPQAVLQQIPWSQSITDDYQQSACAIALANGGIAETGTLFFDSHQLPSALLFLVDTLVVVLDQTTIVARQEQVWSRHKAQVNGVPRAVNLVTGPSRTADVEQVLQIGAHGPKELIVLLVKSPFIN